MRVPKATASLNVRAPASHKSKALSNTAAQLFAAVLIHSEKKALFALLAVRRVNGSVAAAIIRQHEADSGLPWTPIVAVTANALNEDRLRFSKSGIDGLVRAADAGCAHSQ